MDSSSSSPVKREPFAFAATQGIFALQLYTVASITVLYYDHIITFSEEVGKIWNRKISFINTLFIINRYITSLGYIPIAYFMFHSPPETAMCVVDLDFDDLHITHDNLDVKTTFDTLPFFPL